MPDFLHEIPLKIHAWFSEWRMPFSLASLWFMDHGKNNKNSFGEEHKGILSLS